MKKTYVPNSKRAVTNGKIATTLNGNRFVRAYQSGEQLVGDLPANDAPPYTGYVRGWFKKKGKKS